MAVRIVRLGTPRAKGEGPRLGTARRLPRGVRKSEYAKRNYFDVWFPELAPSQKLLSFATAATLDGARWAKFSKRYLAEMRKPAPQRIVNSSSPRSSTARHPPTFVQIRKPTAAANNMRTVGILLGGLVLVAVLVWLAPRDPQPPSAAETADASPRMADAPPDMYPESGTPMPEPAVLALQEAPPPDDTAAADGPEPSPPTGAPDREPESAAAAAPPVIETSARLKKGGTVAGARAVLQALTEAGR